MDIDEYLYALCPALALDINKDLFVQIAIDNTSLSAFGTQYNYAVALRASHEYTLAQKDASETGLVTQKSEQRTSISFWNSISATSNSTFSLTLYGKRLKALIKSKGLSASIGDPSVL